MSATASAHATGTTAPRNTISVPYVVLASVIAIVGLYSLLYWIITFQWIYFLGVVPMAVGGLMFFSPRAGSNHAE